MYQGPVRLVLAPDPKKDRQTNETSFESRVAAWRRWAPDMAVWRSPGNHMTLLRPPHVVPLSDWLSPVLGA
jgi:thioesterase domain-containing protein